MPKLSQRVWDERRRHILESAWRCFGRRGFHATSMDDVVRESGWSPSVVYRYVRGKDELIESAGAESYRELQVFADAMVAADPVPSPSEVVAAFVAMMDDERHGRSYSLAGLVVHSWAEAFDDATIAARGRRSWERVGEQFDELARVWQQRGSLPAGMTVADIAAALTLVAPAVTIDQAFLGGRGTAGLRRLLEQAGPT